MLLKNQSQMSNITFRANADQFVKTLDEVLEWVEREKPHTKQQAKHKG